MMHLSHGHIRNALIPWGRYIARITWGRYITFIIWGRYITIIACGDKLHLSQGALDIAFITWVRYVPHLSQGGATTLHFSHGCTTYCTYHMGVYIMHLLHGAIYSNHYMGQYIGGGYCTYYMG